MKTLKYILLSALLITINYSQPLPENGKGSISGSVIDFITKQPLIGANIIILGTTIGAATNINGNFRIDDLNPNSYQLRASVIGYESLTKTDVIVSPGRLTQVFFELNTKAIEFEGIVIKSDYFGKNPFEVNSVRTFGYEEIRRSPG
ncbi:MAG: carboxypeptidase-like regulatory domain-containing protein, partial [Ignavibacteriaceae bacterium]|nr:carboxypeptidase-like regulatory domain-containing protein [Ignavibacteriaceae bacterium]